MNFLNHYDTNPNYKYGEWDGCRPQKFRGGNRKHDNHPLDELDNLLNGSHLHAKPLGPCKKRFDAITTIGTDELPRPHIRPNVYRNESKVCFNPDSSSTQSRLMKISGDGTENARSNSIADNYSFLHKNTCLLNSNQNKLILASPHKNKYEGYELKRPY